MILNNIEKFVFYVPTAQGSDLEALRTFLEDAEQWLSDKLTGPGLYDLVSAADETDGLKRQAQTVVCLRAYETAVPFLDLIQTPNGFAVVNNSNQVPASRERVERLSNFVTKRLTAALDKTICYNRQNEKQ